MLGSAVLLAAASIAVIGCGSGTPATTEGNAPGGAPAHAGDPATAPDNLHFIAKGDWGYSGRNQAAVSTQMCASHAARPAKFILSTGDNFYNPDGVATKANFDDPEACLIATGLPWKAVWGNHDIEGDSTATRLNSPERWYTFAEGPVRFVMLDGNQPTSPGQLRFLEDTLKKATEPVRIAVIHQPAYTAGFHGPEKDQQKLMVPLWKRYGVSLVLNGHNHDYERIERDGITYIVTGGGGYPLYPCVRFPEGLKKCTPKHHFLEVDASTFGINVKAIDKNGTVFDAVTVPIRDAAAPEAAAPSQPAPPAS